VNEGLKLDALLDATAFAVAIYHGDEEGLRAVLDANRSSPRRLEYFIRAVGFLLVRALEDRPEGGVDDTMAQVRQAALEQR
jgi:hypothetical protein